MAIIIPSKNIYSINFDPVIDNQIDKVEFTVIDSQIVSDTVNVFNAKGKENDFNYDVAQTSQGSYTNRVGSSAGQLFGTYNSVKPTYYKATIKIPIAFNNSRIKELLTGTNNQGNPHISSSISGTYKKFEIQGYANISNVQDADSGFKINNIEVTNKNLIESTNNYSLFHTNKTYENVFNSHNTVANRANSTLEFLTKDNLLTVAANTQIIDGKEYFVILLQVLVGLQVEQIQLMSEYVSSGIYSITHIPITPTMSKLRYIEEYIPTQINISFYGNVVQLDLKDNTLTTGNGNKVFSFDGNELIQITNTPTQESKYQSVVDEWKNGKQTAVISCPITDYYDENGNKVIATSTGVKIMFDIGDIVIPYRYTNQGDKPMSYNKNLTPKQFKVIGTKISKTQGVTQDLTLQEV